MAENKTIEWQSPEFIQFKRTTSWYVILIVAGLGLATAFYFLGQNYLGMIAVILAAAVMIILSKQKPKMINYIFNPDSISIKDKIYPLGEFKSFYITFVNDIPNLHIERNRKLSSPISIILDTPKQNEIIDFVKSILPENTKINYTANDVISNWFKF